MKRKWSRRKIVHPRPSTLSAWIAITFSRCDQNGASNKIRRNRVSPSRRVEQTRSFRKDTPTNNHEQKSHTDRNTRHSRHEIVIRILNHARAVFIRASGCLQYNHKMQIIAARRYRRVARLWNGRRKRRTGWNWAAGRNRPREEPSAFVSSVSSRLFHNALPPMAVCIVRSEDTSFRRRLERLLDQKVGYHEKLMNARC